MPSPTAGLFGGLAQGIFGRMREHEDEQRKMDLEEKQGALKSLGSLLEHATPETRPTIYKQMAEVMKLKGKHRGVWDMLTGGGRDDYHNQLSSQLDSVFGNVVGPEKYAQLQQEGVKQDLGAAFQANDPRVRSSQPLPQAGKIALRDPIAEHLTSLRTQYGMQNDRRSQEIELRAKLQGENQAANDMRDAINRKDIEGQKAMLRAWHPIMQRAQAFAGSMNPDEASIEKAAEEYATKNGLDLEKLRETIPALKARTYMDTQRGKLAESQIGTAQPGDVGFGIRPGQQISLDREQDRAADKEFGDYQVHVNAAKLYDEEFRSSLDRLQKQLQAKNLYYKDGMIYQAGTNLEQPTQLRRYEELIKELDTKKAKAAEQLGLAEGKRATLGKTYGSLYDTGKDVWGVSRRADVGGVAGAGAPRTSIPEWKVPTAGTAPLGNVQEYNVPAVNSKGEPIPTSKVGDVIQTGRGSIRILGIIGKKPDGTIRYKVEVVK